MSNNTDSVVNFDDIEIEIRATQDDIPVRGNALASGDDDLDKQVEDEILERLESGDVWAWASVEVYAYLSFDVGNSSIQLISESEYLGGCSYKNEQDFIDNSGYYDDMKKTVINDLKTQLIELKKRL